MYELYNDPKKRRLMESQMKLGREKMKLEKKLNRKKKK